MVDATSGALVDDRRRNVNAFGSGASPALLAAIDASIPSKKMKLVEQHMRGRLVLPLGCNARIRRLFGAFVVAEAKTNATLRKQLAGLKLCTGVPRTLASAASARNDCVVSHARIATCTHAHEKTRAWKHARVVHSNHSTLS